MASPQTSAVILAGIPFLNQTLYHRIRFAVPDTAVFIECPDENGRLSNTLIVRSLEVSRAKATGRFDRVATADDFKPTDGLSGDRDTASAQAAAECLRRAGVSKVASDRTLPLIFVHHLEQAGVEVVYDDAMGVTARRIKDEQELANLRQAQAVTESAMLMACRLIAHAEADDEGVLHVDGDVLTSERVRRAISVHLLERGYSTPMDSIVASVPHVADCHHFGTGPLQSGLPVIIDIFPRNEQTRYWGDCTRTVVHGQASDELRAMHEAVVKAKAAAIASLRAGTTGEAVHEEVVKVIKASGYRMAMISRDSDADDIAMRHGTGHGIGLEVHEPGYLSKGGGELFAGEVYTVEPGLYSVPHGGVRIEDMLAVTEDGCENFNHLPEGLDWSDA